jgi:hypothetical protein
MLQKLHDSEINAQISTFFDKSISWKLGDEMNGWTHEGVASSVAEAEEQMAEAATKQWPDSAFAQAQA